MTDNTREGKNMSTGLVMRPAETDMETQEIRRLLIGEIKTIDVKSMPHGVVHDDGTLRAAFIGAWAQDSLVGAAFVRPAIPIADQVKDIPFGVLGPVQASKLIREHVVLVEGIVVSENHRREGIGLEIKRFCDAWAAQHDAVLSISVPTSKAARELNKAAGHIVLEAGEAFVIQVLDDEGTKLHPVYGAVRSQHLGPSTWAFKPLVEPDGFTIRTGVGAINLGTGLEQDKSMTVIWYGIGVDGRPATSRETLQQQIINTHAITASRLESDAK